MLRRLQERAGVFWRMASYAVLGFFWAITLDVFWTKMAPRFAYILAGRPIGNDPPCPTPECDFSVFWPAGYMARTHELLQIYQPRIFEVWGQNIFFSGALHETFYYPPTMLLPGVMISYLPFEAAFFVWTAVGVALAAWLLRRAGFSWLVILCGLLSPAALWNAELGQVGALGGAILLAGLMALREAPGTAGALLGLLSLKPQIGVMVPAAFAGLRSLRAATGFAAVCVALILLSLALFGWPVWAEYLTAGRAAAAAVLEAPFLPAMASGTGVSVFWMLRSLGAGLPVAYAAQGVIAVLAMLGTAYLWSRRAVPVLDVVALTVFLSLLAVPYGYGDDMVAWSVVLAALAARRGWRIGMLDALFWVWPAACQVVTVHTGVLLTPLVVALAVLRTLHEAGLLHWRRVLHPA